MLKLHGAPLSNYYNIAKCALLEKGLDFEEVLTPPSQDPEYTARSAMGKIPCIETAAGFLAETAAILDYLEEAYPDQPLLPGDAFQRAKVRELCRSLELYIELVARQGYQALRNKEVSPEVIESIRHNLPRGAAAIKRLAKFSPWIAGEQFSYADLFGYFSFLLATRSAAKNADLDLFGLIPGAQDWFTRVGERASVKKALADQTVNLKN